MISFFSSSIDGSSGSIVDAMLVHLEVVRLLKIGGCFTDDLGLDHGLVVCGFELVFMDSGFRFLYFDFGPRVFNTKKHITLT